MTEIDTSVISTGADDSDSDCEFPVGLVLADASGALDEYGHDHKASLGMGYDRQPVAPVVVSQKTTLEPCKSEEVHGYESKLLAQAEVDETCSTDCDSSCDSLASLWSSLDSTDVDDEEQSSDEKHKARRLSDIAEDGSADDAAEEVEEELVTGRRQRSMTEDDLEWDIQHAHSDNAESSSHSTRSRRSTTEEELDWTVEMQEQCGASGPSTSAPSTSAQCPRKNKSVSFGMRFEREFSREFSLTMHEENDGQDIIALEEERILEKEREQRLLREELRREYAEYDLTCDEAIRMDDHIEKEGSDSEDEQLYSARRRRCVSEDELDWTVSI